MQRKLHLEANPTVGSRSVLVATGSLADSNSGPFNSLLGTVDGLANRGWSVRTIGTLGAHESVSPLWEGQAVVPFRRMGPSSLHYAPALSSWLSRLEWRPELISLQSIWLSSNSAVSRWAVESRIPYMITPHGNFNPVALGFSRAKKMLARHWFVKRMLEGAACYHALNEAEFRHIRAYGIDQPACIIPNGVRLPGPEESCEDGDLSDDAGPSVLNEEWKVCLYLGRLHPIKNIEGLIKSWGTIGRHNRNWLLAIAGDGETTYREHLERLAQFENGSKIVFLGRLEGARKAAWLRRADLFALLSFSEGMPMAPLEAMAYNTPVLLSRQCNMPDVEHWNAGRIIEPEVGGLEPALEELLSMPEDQLLQVGKNAYELVKCKYSWTTVTRQMAEVFEWILERREKPEFVYLK